MPFSEKEFYSVFEQYNIAIWPLPIIVYLMGAIMVGLLFWERRASSVLILTGLAALWAVNGLVYQAQYFAAINPMAYWFASLFVLEALLLGFAPFAFGTVRFRARADAQSIIGLVLVAFSMILYPLWGWLAGHSYPAVPMFGVAPCPTTIFSIGLLLMADWRVARWLLILPAIWTLIGGSAAFLLGVPQDLGLIAAFLALATFAIIRSSRRHVG